MNIKFYIFFSFILLFSASSVHAQENFRLNSGTEKTNLIDKQPWMFARSIKHLLDKYKKQDLPKKQRQSIKKSAARYKKKQPKSISDKFENSKISKTKHLSNHFDKRNQLEKSRMSKHRLKAKFHSFEKNRAFSFLKNTSDEPSAVVNENDLLDHPNREIEDVQPIPSCEDPQNELSPLEENDEEQLKSRLTENSEGEIIKREFFEYDENGALVKETWDDGQTLDPDDLTDVTERHIKLITPRAVEPIGLPEIVEEYDLDMTTYQLDFQETVINHHSPEGILLQEDHYDSNGNYSHSLNWEENIVEVEE
jgi:hypothetical protein